jgi:hypothetical protein
MITPIIERLLLTGKAKKKNFTFAISAAGTISCPKDRWLIITDLWAYPVICSEDAGSEDTGIASLSQRAILQLRMQSTKKEERYIFRNKVSARNTDKDGLFYHENSECEHRDIFDVHESSIHLSLSFSPDITASVASDNAVLDGLAQQDFPPNGYGITIPVLKRLVQQDNSTVVFCGLDSIPGLTINAGTRDQWTWRIDPAVTQPFPASGLPFSNNNIPIFSFTIIDVDSKALQNVG